MRLQTLCTSANAGDWSRFNFGLRLWKIISSFSGLNNSRCERGKPYKDKWTVYLLHARFPLFSYEWSGEGTVMKSVGVTT